MTREKMWIFCFLFWTAVRASEEPLYRKIGENVVLTPDSVASPITSIRWKRGPDIAMQWNGDDPLPYKQFKDRGSLNISTGVMTITGLTRDDSGIYTAEINGKETSKTELLVISPVPKPTIYKSCDTGMTSCVLTCEGSTIDAEPVTYWWTADEKRWRSTKEHKITKEDKEWWFSCTLENPVSTNSSEKVFTLLMIISDQTWIYILIPVILVVCIIVILIIYFIHRYIKGDAVDGTGQGFKPQWQYAGERRGEWWDFRETTEPPNGCSVTNDDVEKWYQKKTHDKMPFTVNGDSYALDFDEMIQTNLETKTQCKVRRVMLPPECQYIGVSCSDRLLQCSSCH